MMMLYDAEGFSPGSIFLSPLPPERVTQSPGGEVG